METQEIEWLIDNVSSCMEEVSKKFAHRDIKPANILWFNNGDYKLTDLGVSVNIHSSTSTARVVQGTKNYLSHAFESKFSEQAGTRNVVGANFTSDELLKEDSFNFALTLF